MFKMIAADITAPYSLIEAWSYDRFIAPAVTELIGPFAEPRLARLRRGAALLDVGCGGGQNLMWIAEKRPDLSLVGLDLSEGQIGRLRVRAASRRVAVEAVRGSALDLPFESGRFDGLMSVGSIKHWPDPRCGLAECVRVLAPGGFLSIVEIDRGCRLDEAREFVRRTRVPSFLLPVALAGFRTWVAGQALDLDETRELIADLPLDEPSVTRLPGVPALVIEGRKPSRAAA